MNAIVHPRGHLRRPALYHAQAHGRRQAHREDGARARRHARLQPVISAAEVGQALACHAPSD